MSNGTPKNLKNVSGEKSRTPEEGVMNEIIIKRYSQFKKYQRTKNTIKCDDFVRQVVSKNLLQKRKVLIVCHKNKKHKTKGRGVTR